MSVQGLDVKPVSAQTVLNSQGYKNMANKVNGSRMAAGAGQALGYAAGGLGMLNDAINSGMAMAQVPENDYQENIDDLSRRSFETGSYEELANLMNSTSLAKTDYTTSDVLGMSDGEAAGQIIGNTLQGAMSGLSAGGMTPAGGIMAGIGAGIQALSSGIGYAIRKRKASNQAQQLNYNASIANQNAIAQMEKSAMDIGKNTRNMEQLNLAAFGGPLDTTFTNGVRFITEGGSHEQNPLGGVFQGIASDGIPNLVEEGEVIYDDYVYSKRLKVPQADKESLGLKKDKEYTYADAAKQIQKESEERPNDPISKRNLAEMMGRLQDSQEALKEKRDGQALKRAVNKMTPDELAMFMQQLQQPQQMQPMMAMQSMQPMQPTQSEVPMFDKGGYIFKDGGIKDKVKEFIHKFYTPKFQDLTPNEIWNLPYTENPSELPKGFQYIKLSNNRGPGAVLDYVIGDSIGNDGSKWAVKYTALSPWHSGNGWALDRRAVNLGNKKEENRIIYVPPTDKSILEETAQGEEYGNAAYKELFAKGGLLGHRFDQESELTHIGINDPYVMHMWDTNVKYPAVRLESSIGAPVSASDILASDNFKQLSDRVKNQSNSDNSTITDNPFAQALRTAPVLGSLATTIASLFDKPNYSNIERAERAMASVPRVSAIPVGQRLGYTPIDINYIATQQTNQGLGARRALNEYGAGNPAGVQQAVIANNYANQTALANAIMQANQLNRQNLTQALEFNRQTDSSNAASNLQAALTNQQRDMTAADFLFRTGQLRDAELARVQANRSANLTNLLNNLGNLGTDMLNREQAAAVAASLGVTYNDLMKALALTSTGKNIGAKRGKLNTKKGGKNA